MRGEGKQLLIHSTAWIDLKDIMLRENHFQSYILWSHLYSQHDKIPVMNRPLVDRGQGWKESTTSFLEVVEQFVLYGDCDDKIS